MVRVLIDATAVPADRGGVGRYVDGLIPALVDLNVETQVVCQSRDIEHYGQLSKSQPVLTGAATARPASRLIWEQVGLPRIVSQVRPDVLHSPHYTQPLIVPLIARTPSVVTIHDATFFTDPQLHSRVKGPFFRTATRLALRRAGCCVVPSQATADELVRVAAASPQRLQVAHHGVDRSVFSPPSAAEKAEVAMSLGLAKGQAYVAFLGTLEPRKNVPALIAAWSRTVLDRPNPPALVLAGAPGWDDTIDAAVTSVNRRLTVLRPGYLPLEQLSGFLGGALLVCYPSLFEGFGLPVLEAMACGAAVLTTRRGPLPEVGGDAVAYTEPDIDSIANDIAALLDDDSRRSALGAAGVRRAATFTWRACAEQHVRAYEAALGSGR